MSFRFTRFLALAGAATLCSLTANAAYAAQTLTPPDISYEKLCKLEKGVERDTRKWDDWDGKSSALPGETLLDLGRLYLRGSAQQAANPTLAHKLLKLASEKQSRGRGGALVLLAETYAKGIGTAQDGVKAKETYQKALDVNARGAGYALGRIFEEEGELSKAAAAYSRDASTGNPASALALAQLYESGKVTPPATSSANDMVTLAQNMLLEQMGKGDCEALTQLGTLYLRGESVPRDEATAAKWFEAAARGKHINAMLYLAKLYQRGVGVPHDRKKVQQLWEEAAKLGNPEAMYNLGFSYVFGDYVDQNTAEGVKWLEQAAARYHLESMYLLYKVYRGDYGGQTNNELAIQWLRKASEHPAAKTEYIFELGENYKTGRLLPRDYGKALQEYLRAAKLGDVDGPFKAGELYQQGLGTKPEPKLALRFYRLAANRGNKEAMMAMYYNYFCGISVKYDAGKAQRWLDRAISNASYDGLLQAQQMYQQRNTSEDMEFALALLNRAASLGDRKAVLELAHIYHQGRPGVGKDEDKVKALLEQAVAPGEFRPDGLAGLASLYLEGDMVKRNPQKAIAMLNEAAKYHHAVSLRKLGKLYAKGVPGVPADPARSLTYLNEAASLGDAAAMLALAKHYRGAAVTEEDRQAALDWYTEAGLHGDPEAIMTLIRMYDGGVWVDKNDAKVQEWLSRLQSPESCKIPKDIYVAQVYTDGLGTKEDTKVAAAWFERAQRNPVVEISDMKSMALAYSRGYGVKPDADKAFVWRLKLAEKGDVASMRGVAQMYADGIGTTQDIDEALRWYHKAAATGSANAHMDLARLYFEGHGVERDEEEAAKYLGKAAELGSQKARQRLGELALANKDYKEAVRWLELGAKGGDVNSMFQLVRYYSDKSLPLYNPAKARQWMDRAEIAGGNSPADMAKIGEAYLNGVGVAPNPKVAAEWFYKSAKGGNARAMRNLGKLYLEGNGVAQDRDIATQWYMRAARSGDSSAMVALADAYSTGSGVPVNYVKASHYYGEAAQRGSTRAMREIGFLYMRGRGVDRDEKQGIKWISAAAEKGDVKAMEELARSYAAGFGVPESAEQAIHWWQMAAKAGSVEAKRQLEIAAKTGYAPASTEEE